MIIFSDLMLIGLGAGINCLVEHPELRAKLKAGCVSVKNYVVKYWNDNVA